MKPYRDLDKIGQKAWDNEKRLSCDKCPANGKCSPTMYETCDYIYLTAFKCGYNVRKKETRIKNKKNEKSE